MPPVIPAEGMTMKYSRMPSGEYVWTIHTDKGDTDRSNRSSRDHSSRNNLDANLVFEDENLINYGDFYFSSLLDLGCSIKHLLLRLSAFTITRDNVSRLLYFDMSTFNSTITRPNLKNFQQMIDYDFSHLRNIVCCVNNINQYTKKDVPDYEIGEYGYLKRTNPIVNKEAPEPPDLDKLPEIYKTIPDNIAFYVKTPGVITQEHEILDVDHINQQDIDILKQAYSGVSPILEQLDNLSAAGLVSLYSLYEHIWDEVNLKMKVVRMTNYKNR